MDADNQYESTYPTIADVQNLPNENIAVIYSSSTDNEWVAFALQTNQLIRRYERINSVTTITDEDTLDFGMLQESSSGLTHESLAGTTTDASKDILRIDGNKDETISEYTIGVTNSGLYVGVENGGEVITGLQGDRERRETDASNLDRHGVPSELTRTVEDTSVTGTYGTPTTALSAKPDQGILRIDSDTNGRNPIRIGIYNDSGGDSTPDIRVHGVSYKVTPITSDQMTEDILYGNGYNRRVLTYGSYETTSPNIPEAWKDGRITVTDEDVRSILGA